MGFFTIYVNKKILGIKHLKNKECVILFMGLIFIDSAYFFIEYYFSSVSGVITIDVLLSVVSTIIFNIKIGNSILLTTISLTVNYIVYSIATFIVFWLHKMINMNDLLSFLLIIIIYSFLIYLIINIKRIKNGVNFLKNNRTNDYLDILVLNISSTVFFTFIILLNFEENLERTLLVFIIIFSGVMFITIQKSLQLYYKQKMLIKDLEETKAELENKRKEVEELEKENLNFSKVSHSIAHKQKSLEFKLNELSMNSEISSEISLKDRVDKLGKELAKETISVIEKTGIEEIDDMLKYMQAECIKNKIDFQLQLSGNIYTMINHYIDKEELEILLADHIKNAIIAISYTDNLNKSILVRLGKLDGYYGLYIYDSGIEFEVKTLYKLGKIPATTHKDNGGTGMGFMNTFDTLRKHKASFVIEEYGKPVKNNFTKALKFIFNEKNEFKIYSYRWEEIRKENKEDNFVIEKLNI